MTIQDRIKKVRTDAGLTQEQFSSALSVKRANYAQIELGNQLPTLEIITGVVRIFNKSYSWIIEGKEEANLTHAILEKSGKKGKESGKESGKGSVSEAGDSYTKLQKANSGLSTVIEHVIDTSGRKIIPLTDIKAAAGGGYINVEDLTPEDFIYIPNKFLKYKNTQHLCVRAKGPSMSPTVQDGSWLPISLLTPSQWGEMPDKQCYVVVDKEGKTFFKRVKNRLASRGQITLMSDNPDKVSHANFDLREDEIQSIWFVEFGLIFRLSNIHDQYYGKLSQMEDDLEELKQQMDKLKLKQFVK